MFDLNISPDASRKLQAMVLTKNIHNSFPAAMALIKNIHNSFPGAMALTKNIHNSFPADRPFLYLVSTNKMARFSAIFTIKSSFLGRSGPCLWTGREAASVVNGYEVQRSTSMLLS